MGNERSYRDGRQFRNYEYTTMSARVTINGLTGKMIQKKSDFFDPRNSLPSHSDTSDVYFAPGPDGFAEKAKVYCNRTMILDIDWSHNHTNKGKNGEKFTKGTVHIQAYRVVKVKKDGKLVRVFKRDYDARRMTPAEIEKYGDLIRYFNPNVKF